MSRGETVAQQTCFCTWYDSDDTCSKLELELLALFPHADVGLALRLLVPWDVEKDRGATERLRLVHKAWQNATSSANAILLYGALTRMRDDLARLPQAWRAGLGGAGQGHLRQWHNAFRELVFLDRIDCKGNHSCQSSVDDAEEDRIKFLEHRPKPYYSGLEEWRDLDVDSAHELLVQRLPELLHRWSRPESDSANLLRAFEVAKSQLRSCSFWSGKCFVRKSDHLERAAENLYASMTAAEFEFHLLKTQQKMHACRFDCGIVQRLSVVAARNQMQLEEQRMEMLLALRRFCYTSKCINLVDGYLMKQSSTIENVTSRLTSGGSFPLLEPAAFIIGVVFSSVLLTSCVLFIGIGVYFGMAVKSHLALLGLLAVGSAVRLITWLYGGSVHVTHLSGQPALQVLQGLALLGLIFFSASILWLTFLWITKFHSREFYGPPFVMFELLMRAALILGLLMLVGVMIPLAFVVITQHRSWNGIPEVILAALQLSAALLLSVYFIYAHRIPGKRDIVNRESTQTTLLRMIVATVVVVASLFVQLAFVSLRVSSSTEPLAGAAGISFTSYMICGFLIPEFLCTVAIIGILSFAWTSDVFHSPKQ